MQVSLVCLNCAQRVKEMGRLIRDIPAAAGEGMDSVETRLLREIRARTPVAVDRPGSGFLRRSNKALPARASSSGAEKVFVNEAPFALQVHEDMEAFHEVGQAKFMEGPLKEALPEVMQAIDKSLQRLVDGTFR